MSTLAIPRILALATDVSFSESEMILQLADGRTLAVPLEWFPRLLKASPTQRCQWRLIGSGIGIAWDELDEDVSVAGLLSS